MTNDQLRKIVVLFFTNDVEKLSAEESRKNY